MNLLVLEDNPEQLTRLTKIIEKNFFDIRVYQATTVKESFEILKKKTIDLFFLDIHLPDGSGLDFAKKIRASSKYQITPIIFITDNMVKILEAFKEIHCYDFLTKPYLEEEVLKIINIFFIDNQKKSKAEDFILIKSDDSLQIKILIKDIVFIESQLRHSIIHTKENTIKAKNLSLNKILEKNFKDLIQCHKSFAVNLRYISKIEKVFPRNLDIHFNCIDKTAPLGLKYKEFFLERIS